LVVAVVAYLPRTLFPITTVSKLTIGETVIPDNVSADVTCFRGGKNGVSTERVGVTRCALSQRVEAAASAARQR
jgi:hypothetical protein